MNQTDHHSSSAAPNVSTDVRLGLMIGNLWKARLLEVTLNFHGLGLHRHRIDETAYLGHLHDLDWKRSTISDLWTMANHVQNVLLSELEAQSHYLRVFIQGLARDQEITRYNCGNPYNLAYLEYALRSAASGLGESRENSLFLSQIPVTSANTPNRHFNQLHTFH
ncbi:hypothetical protein TREMEDRAFT_60575 [Tremella mesenterica DSM 1558]|uniref:uncharacterized protein n=1 Tax=Tremella mesenterica (strain ATCC 24925 / CBS 8224 / DSM 1558 / NBRC 9311 / NRRL Y-6157 / RJB 2259-6 / UBC 559-6) TaxID=578456 RepID=UPI0003F49618|nr:uncharacterized protein TREMEDRAFT_60575 [Tremella mesenterica DSM 1558]EIW71653.1 hypothetical protein TREMEDRAFT_60575 [Tremella mesenterica DSM 1558]